MDNLLTITCILLTVVATSSGQTSPSQPPAAADCSTLIYGMMDCMTFLSSGENETKPNESCCSGFKTVVETDAECICYAMSMAASLGMGLNMTKAMTMPSACGVSGVPSITTCTGSDSPGASPANPPAFNIPPSLSPTLPIEPPSAASPTTEPPSPAASPGGEPAALSPFAPAPKKSGAYTISATSSTLLIVYLSFSLIFT